MDLKTIIENHLLAIGGRNKVENVTSLQIEFRLVEPKFEVDGVYKANRYGCMRVDIFSGGERVFSEGLNPTESWQYPQGAEHGQPTSQAGRSALAHGIENQLFGLHELESRGHHLERAGRERINGIDYHVIKLTYSDGAVLWRYLNPESWLIERNRERKALHPDVDPTETTIETYFSDHRIVGAILRPFHEKQVDLSTGKVLQTTFIKDLKINPNFDKNLFDCP